MARRGVLADFSTLVRSLAGGRQRVSKEAALRRRAVLIATALASLVVAVGLLVLVFGWLLGIEWAIHLHPDFASMKFNTALGLSLIGTGTLLYLWAPTRPRLRLALAGFVFVLAVTTFSQYVTGIDLGIDQVFVDDHTSMARTSSPGRMSPLTAISLASAAIATASLHLPGKRHVRLSDAAAFLVLFVGILAVLSYVYGAQLLPSFTQVAIHTGACLALLALALLCATPTAGFSRILWDAGPAGSLLRTLGPAAILIPAVGGYLRIRLDEAVFGSDLALGVSAFVAALMAAFAVLVGLSAVQLHRLDLERLALVRKAQELEGLRDLDAFRVRFINTAAHELRTPLLPLRAQIYLLQKGRPGGLSEDQVRSLAIADRNLNRLMALVEDLLEAARHQAGRLGINPKPTDLGLLVREAGETFHAAATAKGIRLEVDVAGDLQAVADAGRVTQVLNNLVGNAVKFTRSGGTIRLSGRGHPDHVEIKVSDTGLGLSADAIPKLFQPFNQVHDASQVSDPGSGLGLYIAKALVVAHGGHIGVHSPGLDKGSTFKVELPRKAVARDLAPGFGPTP